MPCLGFLRTVDRACMRWVSGEVCPPAWVPPMPVLHTLEGKGGGRLGLDSPDSVFGYWLPFLNVFVMTSAPGLLAAHPAGQARGAQAGVVGRMVSGLLYVQALALRGRPLVRPGVGLGSGSRSRGQVPGWEMTAVRPGGAGCLCSRGSAWASPLVPRDTLLLERLQSHVPGRDPQAPRRSCVLVVSREQEALAGQSGIPESQIPPPGSGVSEVHREAAARPQPHLHLHGTKCATSLAPPPPKCNLDSLERGFPGTPILVGRSGSAHIWASPEFSAPLGPYPAMISVECLSERNRVRTLGSALVPTTDLLNPSGLFIWPLSQLFPI